MPQRRDPIAMRHWSEPQRLLRKHNIGHRELAEDSGVPTTTVNRALSLRFFHRTGFGAVLQVRRTAERLLRGCGERIDPNTLWKEYDQQLQGERHAS